MRRTALLAALAVAPLLAAPAQAQTNDPSIFPIDEFLTAPVREAFRAAAYDPERWGFATRDARAYLDAYGIEVPKDLDVAFLDLERAGDWVRFSRPDEMTDMYCPPQRTWWRECRKIIRACDSVTACVKYALVGMQFVCTEVATVDKNCAFVCEESLGEEMFTLPTRPPFPPLPR